MYQIHGAFQHDRSALSRDGSAYDGPHVATPSITGSESFRLRIQRSEGYRAGLMLAVYASLALMLIARRIEGGTYIAQTKVLVPTLGVVLAAMVYEALYLRALMASMRKGVLLPQWRLDATALVELAGPAAVMAILHYWSERGDFFALSAPAIMVFPITIMLSVLRLRPLTTLWLGVGAGVFHIILVLDAMRHDQFRSNQSTALLSFGVLLAMTGVAGMVVTRAVRRYVAEAVEEAQAHERAGLKLLAIERELDVARQIQLGLLPAKPPRFDGFDIAGMNQPADQTGGDYYDWQELPNGRLLAVIADVTGHGIGPALVMAVCRAYSRATAALNSDPQSLMARLNSLLCEDMVGGRFITLAMASLERSGQVELLSAGHGPSLLYRASDRSVEQFGGDGLPLAVMAEEMYTPPRTFRMETGDVLVMLTDGVIEWKNGGGAQFGVEPVASALAACASKPAPEIVDRLHQAVLEHASGSTQNDDVTIVVVKRTA